MNGNKNPKYKLILIICALGFLLGISCQIYNNNDNNPDRMYLKNKSGSVVFEHLKHTEEVEECADCHHDLLLFENTVACDDCHDDDYRFDDFDHDELIEVGDHSCTTCHEFFENVSPNNCGECHPKQQESETTVVVCKSCHEDDISREDLGNHTDFLEIEDHSCDGCHLAQQLNSVYHKQCTRCHLKNNEEMFSKADGKIRCEICHLK